MLYRDVEILHHSADAALLISRESQLRGEFCPVKFCRWCPHLIEKTHHFRRRCDYITFAVHLIACIDGPNKSMTWPIVPLQSISKSNGNLFTFPLLYQRNVVGCLSFLKVWKSSCSCSVRIWVALQVVGWRCSWNRKNLFFGGTSYLLCPCIQIPLEAYFCGFLRVSSTGVKC